MKQYAARGIVDRSGLTWVMRCSLSPPGATGHSGERDDAEGEEDAGTGRPLETFVLAAGDLEVSEDIVMTISLSFCRAERGNMRLGPVPGMRGAKHGSRREDNRRWGFYERPGESAKMREVRA